jgi:hypothetical protein
MTFLSKVRQDARLAEFDDHRAVLPDVVGIVGCAAGIEVRPS